MKLDDEKMKALGLERPGSLVVASAVMRYVAGCILRERERITEILRDSKVSEEVLSKVLSDSDDDKVFRWRGPETPLRSNENPPPAEQTAS